MAGASSEEVVGDAPTAAAPYTRTELSLVRRAYWPSPLEETPGPGRIYAFSRLRASVCAGSILFDLAFYFALRNYPAFNSTAIAWFVSIAVPLLTLSGLLSWFVLRRKGRWYWPLNLLCITCEMTTAVMWIQLTGSVSSYFLMTIPIFVAAYRLYGTYRLGLAAYVIGASLHLGAVLLEEFGVVRPASLFVTDPGAIYSSQLFRISALVSLQMVFNAAFMITNLVSRSLRDKERDLDVAQRNLDRAVAAVQPGRLSSQVLDGKYVLGELLGRGGMGEVYQAQRVDGSGEFAIKVLYAHLCAPDDLVRFRREAAIAAKLPVQHIARVYEVGHSVEGGHHYLVMELLRGEDLGTLLRRRSVLGIEELLPIVDQLANALASAHALGIVHRDLKPQNIFLVGTSGTPQVKLLDFGVARFLEGGELTQSAMLIGSPGYLAPEQASSEYGEVGPRADVFALGTIIYRALTGQSAFAARNPAMAVYEVVHNEPAPPSDVNTELPSDVDAVLAIALAKKPAQRYATPLELARDLRLAFAGGIGSEVKSRAKSARREAVVGDEPLAAPRVAE